VRAAFLHVVCQGHPGLAGLCAQHGGAAARQCLQGAGGSACPGSLSAVVLSGALCLYAEVF
jgi:hypothetical protein